MKVSTSDLLQILKRFNQAGEDDYPRHIDQVRTSHPNPHSTLISLRFKRQRYYVLLDNTAEDDSEYIQEQIGKVTGELLTNPHAEHPSFGLPFKGKEVYLWHAQADKTRLDALLVRRHPDTSRSTWQKHIKAGYVSVNGEPSTSPKHEITDTDHVELHIPEAQDFSTHELPILYLDDNVIVINKPAGVLTHTQNDYVTEFTVAEFFRRFTTFGLDTHRPGIVHRLDRDTSGVMIGARNPETAKLLLRQFAERHTKKTYVAVCDGTPKQSEARIELPIGRNVKAPSTFRVEAGGKMAVTDYKTLATSDNLSLVELRPVTGRTHQLRVHMQYLGTPIHGDRVYGTSADRLYLHAHKLEITIPTSRREVFTAPLPSEFSTLFPGVQFS